MSSSRIAHHHYILHILIYPVVHWELYFIKRGPELQLPMKPIRIQEKEDPPPPLGTMGLSKKKNTNIYLRVELR